MADTMDITQWKGFSLSRNTLKYITMVSMFIDHATWTFIGPSNLSAQILHMIGSLTAPIVFFFIAEGYTHTKSVKKYLLRLFIAAIVSHIPYALWDYGSIFTIHTSVMATLFLALLAITAWDKIANIPLRLLAVAALCALAFYTDWSYYGVIYCLAFYVFRGNFKKQAISIVCLCLYVFVSLYFIEFNDMSFIEYFKEYYFQFAQLLTIPLLAGYNGKKSSGGSAGGKWLFYIFYPVHLLVIYLAGILVEKLFL